MGSVVPNVRIYKDKETQLLVFYRFGVVGGAMGRLALRKVDGFVEEVIPVLHPEGRAIYAQAMRKVLDHWRREEFPDVTYSVPADGFTS